MNIKAYQKLKRNNYECIIATTNYGFSPFRAFKTINNKVSFKWNKFANKRSQDLEELTHDTGSFYLYKTDKLINLRGVLPKKTSYYKINKFRAIDINDFEDLKYAEYLYKFNQLKKKKNEV